MFESSQIILTTCPDMQSAKEIARVLVEKKLAACVKIQSNIESIYFWENEIVEASEVQLVIITRDTKFDDIKNEIKDLHPYHVPEIMSFAVSHGSKEYLSWIKDYVSI